MQTSKTINQSQMATAAKWSLITEIACKLITPLVNIILARLLLPEAFGAVATITMVTSFAEVFTDAGFQKYIIQHEFEDTDSFDKGIQVAFWSNFILSVIVVFIITIFIEPISASVGAPRLSLGIIVASTAIILNSFSSIQLAVYKRNLDFKSLFKIRCIIALVPVAVTIPLSIWLKSYWALVIGTLSSKLVQAVLLFVNCKVKIRFFYSFVILKKMFSFSAWTFLEAIVIWLTTNIDIFLVGRMLNEHYLGLYKTSMTTVNSYLGIVSSAVTSVLFASLSRYQDNQTEFRNVYFKFQKLLGILLIPMGIGMFLFSDLVTAILLGRKWMEASSFIGIWALFSCFVVLICYFVSEVFRSLGKPKISMIYQVLYILILAPAVYVSAQYGYETLFKVRTYTLIGFIALALIFSHLLFKIKVQNIFFNLLPQTISASVMGLCGYGLLKINSSIIWQLISFFICIIVYFIVLFRFKSIKEEILAVQKIRSILYSLNINKFLGLK